MGVTAIIVQTSLFPQFEWYTCIITHVVFQLQSSKCSYIYCPICRQKVEAPKPEASKPFSALEESRKLNAYSSGLLQVDDIDVEDAENPQLVSEYIKDIYLYLRYMEVSSVSHCNVSDAFARRAVKIRNKNHKLIRIAGG